jgi:two-component system nitrogen regulation response regulator NtrX
MQPMKKARDNSGNSRKTDGTAGMGQLDTLAPMVHFIPPSQRRLALLAAQADTAPVLIHGADGTGKGAIARWLHAHGARAIKPFVLANHESSLARQIPLAHEGTLLIPEIGEFPLGEQQILLQYLKTRTVPHRLATPVAATSGDDSEVAQHNPSGGSGETGTQHDTKLRILAQARIIVTTSQSLEGRAQAGLFNEELLRKLNVFRLEMPALERRRHESQDEFEDIVLELLAELAREHHKEYLRELSDDAWAMLHAYDWPGNLRELRNVLRLAVVAAQGDFVSKGDLPELGSGRLDFRATREAFERLYLTELLQTFDWQVDRTCANARIDRSSLLLKMKKYGIRAGSPAPLLPDDPNV